MKKRILRKPVALLLALIMVLSLFPTVSLAADEVDAQVNSITLATDGDAVVPSATPTTIDLSAATENISITSGGDYTLTGSTTAYNVSIDTTDVENKIVNLTLDGASIQIPEDYNKKDVSALSISGDATVNMIVKEGTCNTLSNVCTSGGIGVTVVGNSDLNITDTGTLNITGTSYTLCAKTGSSVSINDATVNIITSMNGKWVNCIELNGAALTVNSGSLNATIPEKDSASSMGTSATIYMDSASSFTQNGGTVKVINQAKVTKSCFGIYDKGVVSINGGTLFAYGQTNGVHINSGLIGIDDDAVFLAASGNVASFDSMKSAVRFASTGKLEAMNDSGKGLVLLKLDSSKPITAKTEIALKHKTTDGFSEEIAETLPMDAYFIAFSARLGDQYCVSAGENCVVTPGDGLYNAIHTLESFIAQPKSVNALLVPLPTSFTISMPKNIEYLKVNSAIKLDISPSYKVDWSSNNTSVATIDGDGVVKALSAGTATITAECLGVTGTYELKTSVMSNPRTFTLNSDNPDVNVVISDGTFTYNPTSIDNGIFSYLLEDGNYTYVVSKEGFPNKEGSFIVSESGNNNVSVSMYYSVTFNLTAGPGVSSVDSASITVLDSENTTVSGINRKYDNLNGKYSYTVTCDGCYTASGFFDSYGTINVILQKDRSGSKEADWKGTFNHDHGNAVITTMLPISADEVYEKWETMVGSSNYGASYAGTSVIIDDYLYITGNGFLNKINTKTGKIIAQVEAGTTGYIYDYLAYGDGMIFLSGSSYISAYEAETLTLLWRTSVGGQHSTQVNGSLNSKGTINKFRPIIYSNGYIFCGKNAFKTTSFEVDKNGFNMPVWSIDDDFNWNTGVIVGDYYYVAAVQTMYVVNYKTGEIVDSWKFSTDNNVYTWGGVTYSPNTQRLYWASYSGAKFYTIKIDTTTGKFLERFCPSMDRRYTVDVSQESVCTPVVFNGRVYLVGQKGNVDVLNAVPTQKNYVYTLETIYTVETPERTKIQSTPILCTAYATEENSNTVYLYFQGYTRPSPIYVLKDSSEINSAENVDIAIVAAPAKSQYAFEQIAVDKKGSLYFFNESGYLFCFEKVDFVTVDSVVALINALPSSKDVTSAVELQIKNARKAYDALTDEQKLEISSQTSKKLTDAESALANLEKPSPDIDKDITVYFTLLGTEKDGENGTVNTLKRGNLTTWIKRQSVTVKSGSTVGDVFSEVLHDNSYRYSGLSGNYIKNITHPSGVTLGEFDNGKLSGWMYTVNGKHPNIALNDYELSNKDEIIWHYTDDYTEEEGSKKWGNKPYEPEAEKDGNVKISIDTTAKTDSTGKAKAEITSKDLKAALDKALEAVKKAEKDGKKNVKPEIKVDVKIDSKASAVETTLQLSSVEELTKAEALLSVNSSIGNIIVENKTLKEVQKAAEGKEISFQIARIDQNSANKKLLTEAQKKAVGENPVYDVSILSGEKKIKTFGSQKLNILLPYTLKSGENANQIAAWYLNDQGKLTKLTSKYDKKTKLVTFEINHLSCFVVGKDITTDGDNGFNDVKKDQWYYDSITCLVEKGIVSGTTKDTFSPNANITRAEFTQILYGMAKSQAGASGSAITAESVKVDANEASKIFSDVKNTDWYAKAVAWAYANDIVKGTKMADNSISFMPNAKITRQDMAVMIQNYIQQAEKKTIAEKNQSISFADDAKIATYAKDAVSMMQKGGIISGIKQEDSSYKFAPKANATRAEAATMIFKYLKK